MKTLERRLGLGGVLGISISAMLGSGLFVLPGLAAAKTGPSVWLAYIVAGLCVLPAALSKAELATAMPTSGGTYVYLDRTFGPLAGTIAGLGLWMSLLLKSAFALVGFGAYLSVLAALPLKVTALCLLVGVLIINIVGVQAVSKLGKLVVVVVLFAMVGLIAGGSVLYDPQLLQPAFPKGTSGFLAAVGFVYVSYAGVTKVAAIAEEVSNPNRNLPLGILISLVVVTCVYGAVVHMLVAVVPYEELATDLHPIYTLAERVAGSKIAIGAAILGVVTMTTMATAGVLATSRFPFAMSRDDLLPAKLSRLHPKYVTPMNAILITGAIMALAIVFLEVEKIAKLASGFKIMIFMAVNGAVIVMRESGARWYKPGFRAPLYPYVQILGIVLGAILLVALGLTALLAAIGIAVPSAIFYMLYGRKRTTRRGVIGIFGKREDLISEPISDIDENSLERSLPSEASVFVPLFGTERSPETLVEVGVALADGRKVEVLHITQVPEQLSLEHMLDDDPLTSALRRRIEAMAKERDVDIEFDTTVSRDVVRTIHEVANRVHCEWTVMEWPYKSDTRYRVGLSSPIGWLQDHLPCSLAVVKDAGVRRIREILVYSNPGPHDRAMLECADRIALDHGATLSFARYESPDMSKEEVMKLVEYTERLSHRSLTRTRDHVTVTGALEVEAMSQMAAAYDLLVLPAPANRGLLKSVFGTRTDRLIHTAPCAVVWVKDPRAKNQTQDSNQPDRVDLDAGLERSWVGARVETGDLASLYARMTDDLHQAREIPRDELLAALLERERIHSTAIGDGVAVPHGIVAGLTRTWLGVYTVAKPLEIDSPDGVPVDIFFVTIGPDDARETHLMVLSEVARLLTTTNLADEMRAAQTSDALYEAIHHAIRESG